jgi:uncharacterized membrane protein YeaQ/YmgE (transglycosylase-associated protein family)
MSMESLVIWLIVGGIAGFLAASLMNSGGLRLTGHHLVDTIITGIIGAVIGGWVFNLLKISLGSSIINSIVSATAGAVLLIFGLRLLKR